jgi:hypothetical protein
LSAGADKEVQHHRLVYTAPAVGLGPVGGYRIAALRLSARRVSFIAVILKFIQNFIVDCSQYVLSVRRSCIPDPVCICRSAYSHAAEASQGAPRRRSGQQQNGTASHSGSQPDAPPAVRSSEPVRSSSSCFHFRRATPEISNARKLF